MSASAFVQLCTGFCKIARVAAPELQAQGNGTLALHADWHGVTIDIIYQQGSEDYAFALFQLGPIDEFDQRGRQILLALLQANFLSLRLNPPTFSCHPGTGDGVLQYAFPLAKTSPAALHTLVNEGVNLALEWRRNSFLAADIQERELATQQFA